MSKALKSVYPNLEARRKFNKHTTSALAQILEISEDSVRRRLRGDVEFELSEVVKLMNLYECTFEDLFGDKMSTVLAG